MTKTIISVSVVALLFAGVASSVAPIKFDLSLDKQLHFLVGAFILFTFAAFGYPIYGLIAACVIGVLKEVMDYFRPKTNTAEIADILYTAAGASVAFGVVWVAAQ